MEGRSFLHLSSFANLDRPSDRSVENAFLESTFRVIAARTTGMWRWRGKTWRSATWFTSRITNSCRPMFSSYEAAIHTALRTSTRVISTARRIWRNGRLFEASWISKIPLSRRNFDRWSRSINQARGYTGESCPSINSVCCEIITRNRR